MDRMTPISGLEDFLTDPAEVKRRVKQQKKDMSRTLMSQMTEKRLLNKEFQNTEMKSDKDFISEVNVLTK
jgi:hypothetical protein